jgi:tetratricopeptide (TPR) repeat protein
MQLKAHLRELHQLAAETMERLYTDHLARWYADLALHYEKAEITDKAVEYLQKAGDEAKAQYQNQQALSLYNRLLSHLQEMFGFTEVEIDTLLKKAEILELIGEWKECQMVCEDALQFAEQMADKRRMGQAKLLLGILCRRTGQYDKAIDHFERAAELFEKVQDRAGIGHAFRNMGLVYWQKSDFDAAMTCYKKALTICEGLGDRLGIAKNSNNIGILYTELKVDYSAAMKWYQKGLQIFEDLSEKLETSKVLNNMGECHRLKGNYDAAMTYYEQALQLAKGLGAKLEIAIDLGNIGHTYKAQGNYDRAITSYDRTIPILKELGNKFYLGEHLHNKATTLFSLQRYKEAQQVNVEGLHIAEETEDSEYIFKGNVFSTKIDFVLGNKDTPLRLSNMLGQTKDDTKLATLHYELWKMSQDKEHGQIALKLYKVLYTITPNIEYKTRVEELQESEDTQE